MSPPGLALTPLGIKMAEKCLFKLLATNNITFNVRQLFNNRVTELLGTLQISKRLPKIVMTRINAMARAIPI